MGNRSSKKKSAPSTSRRRGGSPPPSTSHPENSQSTASAYLDNLDFSEITKKFECCVCRIIIFGEIVKCERGHNFCPSHSSLLANCPSCPVSQSMSDDLPPPSENLSSSKTSANSVPPNSSPANSGKSSTSTPDKSSENSSHNYSPANSATENSEDEEDMSSENTPPRSPTWSSTSEDEDVEMEEPTLCQYEGDGCPYRGRCQHITEQEHEPNCEYRLVKHHLKMCLQCFTILN